MKMKSLLIKSLMFALMAKASEEWYTSRLIIEYTFKEHLPGAFER